MARKMNAVLGGIMGAMLSSAQGVGFPIDSAPKLGKSLSGRMKHRVLNPEGFRGKPTKRRLKVKLARKAKLKNQKR